MKNLNQLEKRISEAEQKRGIGNDGLPTHIWLTIVHPNPLPDGSMGAPIAGERTLFWTAELGNVFTASKH